MDTYFCRGLPIYIYIHAHNVKSTMFWILCEFMLTTHKKRQIHLWCWGSVLHSSTILWQTKVGSSPDPVHDLKQWLIWSYWKQLFWWINGFISRLVTIFWSKSLLTSFPFSFRVASLPYSYPFIIKCIQVCPVSDRFSCCKCGFYVKTDHESNIISL